MSSERLIKIGAALASFGQFTLGVGSWLVIAGFILLSELICPHTQFIRRGRGILCLGCGRIEEPISEGGGSGAPAWRRTSNRTWED